MKFQLIWHYDKVYIANEKEIVLEPASHIYTLEEMQEYVDRLNGTFFGCEEVE